MGLRIQPVVGVAAHLTPKKGQRYVIGATALPSRQYFDLLCYLLGEGTQRDELDNFLRAVADRVRFMAIARMRLT